MITLKTLPQATAQEVFDQITQHLLKQGKAAISSTGACRYRVEVQGEVLKCAAGCLIAKNEHSEKFEGEPWGFLVSLKLVPRTHNDLITSLQDMHDACLPSRWPERLRQLAEDYGLQYNPPAAIIIIETKNF